MKEGIKISILLVALSVILTGCKNEYEKIRRSNDPELMYNKANEYFEKEEYDRAKTLYEQAITSYRGKQEAELVFFRYAQSHFYLEQYILAAHYFKTFVNTFINSDKREEAQFMEAYSNYKNSPTYRLDQQYTREAINAFQVYVNTYPRSERVEECNRLIDELRDKLEKKMFEQASLYFDLEQYQAATRTYINVLQEFPDTDNAEEVRYMIVESSYRLARNSIYEKRKERYEETIVLTTEFLDKYQRSEYRREVSEISQLSKSAIKELEYDRY